MKKVPAKSRFSLNLRLIIELICVVMIWRGVWVLLDTFFFPSNHVLSSVLGIVIGILFLWIDDGLLSELRK